MPNLTLRQKWFQFERNIQLGDVVLLAHSMQQRFKWVIRRVSEAYPDKHGIARAVLLRTPGSTMKRPVAKLRVILSESANRLQYFILCCCVLVVLKLFCLQSAHCYIKVRSYCVTNMCRKS